MIYQAQIPVGGLPINLVLVGNRDEGRVVFVKVAHFTTVFDANAAGDIYAAFYEDHFVIFVNGDEEEVFQYNTAYEYKKIPAMLEWLRQQFLQQPE